MKIQQITEIPTVENERISSGQKDFDKFLGGGFVNSQAIFIAGEPGVGKSTLLLQLSAILSDNINRMLYVSGEENLEQLKLRANRLGTLNSNIFCSEDVEINELFTVIDKYNPKFIIVDSLQMLEDKEIKGDAGGTKQTNHCMNLLLAHAKSTGRILILIGHGTKSKDIAGSNRLQHMVDTVLFITKDETGTRHIIAKKNRFGQVDEVFDLHMQETGFKEFNNLVKVKGSQVPLQNTVTELRAKYGDEMKISKKELVGTINNGFIKWLYLSLTDFIERKLFGNIVGRDFKIVYDLTDNTIDNSVKI